MTQPKTRTVPATASADSSPGRTLTPKQLRFVEEYLADLNATRAYLRAGYRCGEEVARRSAARLLTNVDIAAAIAAAKADRSARTKVDADWVLRTLHAEKTADLADIFTDSFTLRPVEEWPEVWRRGLVVGVESFEEYAYKDGVRVPIGMVRKVKITDRTKHIELIGRHVDVQAFKDRSEVVLKTAEQELADLNARKSNS